MPVRRYPFIISSFPCEIPVDHPRPSAYVGATLVVALVVTDRPRIRLSLRLPIGARYDSRRIPYQGNWIISVHRPRADFKQVRIIRRRQREHRFPVSDRLAAQRLDLSACFRVGNQNGICELGDARVSFGCGTYRGTMYLIIEKGQNREAAVIECRIPYL